MQDNFIVSKKRLLKEYAVYTKKSYSQTPDVDFRSVFAAHLE